MEVEGYGSDSNHSDKSDSTHAYKPSKVSCYISVFLFAAYFILIAYDMFQDVDDDNDDEPPSSKDVENSEDDDDNVPLASLVGPLSSKACVLFCL